jgi:mono/diheme cytochrome c family protein
MLFRLERLLRAGRGCPIAAGAFLLPAILLLAAATPWGAGLSRAAQPQADGSAPGLPAGAGAGAPAPGGAAASLYRRYCARCHGEDFAGTPWRQAGRGIPNFTAAAWQEGRSDAQLRVSILEGKGAAMPAFADQLSEGQARDLVALLRGADPARPARASGPPTSFARRYAALRRELEQLQKQFRELSDVGEEKRIKEY